MLKCALLVSFLAAFVAGLNEKSFGIKTSTYILNYYNDQLQVLPLEFQTNIRKFLADVEEKATAINASVGKCVREGAVPVEESLNEEVKSVLDKEMDKIEESLSSLADLDDEGVDKLWTSVSTEGTFRDEMNAAIMSLKGSIFRGLSTFKEEITQKCRPKEKVEQVVVLNRIFG